MFGATLRLISMAAGQGSRRLGDYVKKSVTKYLVLAIAGIPFVAALAFGVLAIFWALTTVMDPIYAAAAMVGILALVGLLIVLIAYGITRERPQSVRSALVAPAQDLQNSIPTVEDVGRQIETAVQRYGPIRVAAAAAAGGIIVGVLAKRYADPQAYERARRNGNGRRYA